ncbi:DUF3883 domain-containing protein [Maribacter sp. BPC-D8]|uniref:DUF3883 domain-containing protein n=1 Tax=Maribacter sp. BPC-D8 TaxID=3053613 RepID=UPI002B4793CC|nr:DUF3883 domain-containing protein [Maribacter sp. BPC-D8]WRI28118.1 DUF3883 domain-containing protein [Maribacter sp. BPC-D8]
MIEITKEIFDKAFSGFKIIVEEGSKVGLTDFKTNPFVIENENYKYEVLKQAKAKLLTKTWKENEIGNGRILEAVKNSIQTDIIYNYKTHQNNLIDWRKKDNFKNLSTSKETEKLLFDFFKSKIKDEVSFSKFSDLGFSYQLIAYLFFIKNPQKYLPISQKKFDLIFSSLGIDLKTSYNISWENYVEFVNIIKQFQNHLKSKFSEIELIDAHSFLWIYLHRLRNPEYKKPAVIEVQKVVVEKQKILDNYQPRLPVNIDDLTEPETEIDYVEQLRKQIEIGNLAEEIVLNDEIQFLSSIYPELANQVRSVANNPKLGFDIISFEKDGTQKQIEVKAISKGNSYKSFIITKNELQKSKTYPNYYLYCVSELESQKPTILRLKHPDFENENLFKSEPLTFRITFE